MYRTMLHLLILWPIFYERSKKLPCLSFFKFLIVGTYLPLTNLSVYRRSEFIFTVYLAVSVFALFGYSANNAAYIPLFNVFQNGNRVLEHSSRFRYFHNERLCAISRVVAESRQYVIVAEIPHSNKWNAHSVQNIFCSVTDWEGFWYTFLSVIYASQTGGHSML